MKLDVVVPTYNRSQLLRRTISSLLNASIPESLDINIIVVDNNSKDDTEQVVRSIPQPSDRRLTYIKETNQGLSHARNGGIRAGTGDIIGFIDDDEEIGEHWFRVVANEFADDSIDFIGGPYLANWAAPQPAWLPPGYHAVIGVIDPKPRSPFGGSFTGNLMGGNAVIRRRAFDRVGLYSPKLGRSGKGLLTEEDAEMYRRLQAANMNGIYTPDLIIYHHIPAERLTRKYHRRWCYWRGVSQGYADRETKEQVPYAFSLPRYRISRALKGIAAIPRQVLSSDAAPQAFASELAVWELLGFIHGKHFIDMDRYYDRR